jgi:hypothetical protein
MRSWWATFGKLPSAKTLSDLLWVCSPVARRGVSPNREDSTQQRVEQEEIIPVNV